MEVHHSHHPAHPKKWKEYILEFAMLFLAVTLGFVAENIREHYVEQLRARQYLEQLVADLKEDTAKIDYCIRFKLHKEQQADSIIQLLKAGNGSPDKSALYYYGRILVIREPFYGTEGTLNQLEHAGGLRIIENDSLIRKINEYIAAKAKIYQIQNMQDFYALSMSGLSGKVYDPAVFHRMLDTEKNKDYPFFIRPPEKEVALSVTDPQVLNEYAHSISMVMTNEVYTRVLLGDLKEKASALIERIENARH
jgi:hypothetical protein